MLFSVTRGDGSARAETGTRTVASPWGKEGASGGRDRCVCRKHIKLWASLCGWHVWDVSLRSEEGAVPAAAPALSHGRQLWGPASLRPEAPWRWRGCAHEGVPGSARPRGAQRTPVAAGG